MSNNYGGKGEVNFKYTGAAWYGTNAYHVRGGCLDQTYNGVVKFEGKTYKVSDGSVLVQGKTSEEIVAEL